MMLVDDLWGARRRRAGVNIDKGENKVLGEDLPNIPLPNIFAPHFFVQLKKILECLEHAELEPPFFVDTC